MAFTINTNISSLLAQQYLSQTGDFQAKTIGRVTSGLRILNAGDDAAGLAIANGFRSDQAVLTQGIRNANDGVATLQTIDGGISNIGKLLDRARTLASQSASGTFVGDRNGPNTEFQNVLAEINRQAQSIGMVAGGDFAKSLSVFLGGGRAVTGGTSATSNGAVTVDLSNSLLDATSLGLGANGAVGTADLRAGTNNLSLALGMAAPTFEFSGLGFSFGLNFGVSVTLSNADWAAITDENSLVTKLNAAITAAGAGNAAFAAAGFRASVDPTTGYLAFTSSTGFQVQPRNASAKKLVGSVSNLALNAGGSAAIRNTGWVNMSGGATQKVTFSYRDSSNTLQTKTITLDSSVAGSVDTVAHSVATINGSAGTGSLNGFGGIFALDDGIGEVNFMSQTGTAFSVSVAQGSAAQGFNGGTLIEFGSAKLAGGTNLDISSPTTATAAVTAISAAVATLGGIQANVGKSENELNFAVSLASTQLTNLAASESRIRDADLASEAANLTKAQILTQAGIAALAQANSAPQAVLSLLK